MKNVYSYIRFSSARQRGGSSVDRQLDYARRWAAENGMNLDESLTMRDEGLSAYHQRHVRSGALGAFLEAVRGGRIAAGSVLVVEGLDRLSRAEPILAQAQLAEIINAEITVVTACDGKQYNRDRLKANPMDLVYSLLVMIRAHEESETKSQRARAAIRRHCDKWEAGGRAHRRIGRPPEWLQPDGDGWSFVADRLAAVRLALDGFRRGLGNTRIADDLAAAGLSLTGGVAHANQIYRLVRNPALKGDKVLTLAGERYELAGYYPAVISGGEFAELQQAMARRARTGGAAAGKIPGVVTGTGVAVCGYCGGPMVACNVMARARPDGTLAAGNRRIVCSCHADRRACPYPQSASVVPIERAIFDFCGDRINLAGLFGGDRQAPARARRAAAMADVASIEAKLARVTDALLAADDAAPLAFVRKARELEAELATARAAAMAAEREIEAAAVAGRPARAEAWAALANGVQAMDAEARLTARKLIADTFERIVIYARGFVPDAASRDIGITLVSRSGAVRMLVVDRKSGAWRAAEDFSDSHGD
jgi:DNA invertase Pin-like site-specific DNA recombinase